MAYLAGLPRLWKRVSPAERKAELDWPSLVRRRVSIKLCVQVDKDSQVDKDLDCH